MSCPGKIPLAPGKKVGQMPGIAGGGGGVTLEIWVLVVEVSDWIESAGILHNILLSCNLIDWKYKQYLFVGNSWQQQHKGQRLQEFQWMKVKIKDKSRSIPKEKRLLY